MFTILTNSFGWSAKCYIALFILFFGFSLTAQQVNNIHYEQKDDLIHIYYDLTGVKGVDKYTVEVYCSEDGGITWGLPLQQVTGHAGEHQTAGTDKTIIWNALAERNVTVDDIFIKIVAKCERPMSGVFTDPRDGHVYAWVRLGDLAWMTENLSYLPAVQPPIMDSGTDPCYYVLGYNGTNVSAAKAEANYKTYGVLYNWAAAVQSCPAGWHLSSDDEWKQLEMALGMSQAQADATGWRGTDEGGKLKVVGYNYWLNPNLGATNSSGFKALPGGYRHMKGTFTGDKYNGFWWTSSEVGSGAARRRRLSNNNMGIAREIYYKGFGYSVRCVQDQ
ncbi:MAG: fibrobacter succinogenes major paralogous domain-containing protein [Bacteroidales bacterium]|nr:fibrobacter succinogenes major paralogous domain-containing protein [Bacteroidales bacterium]